MPVIVTTTESVPGRTTAEVLGVVAGEAVKTAHLGKDIKAAVRDVFGGSINAYETLLDEARQEAARLMEYKAGLLGADAVVAMRYSSAYVGRGGVATVVAYGTAVKLVKTSLPNDTMTRLYVK